MINCRDCAKALNPFLDRELSDEDVVQVRGHLEACGGCLHVYQFEESLRRLVRIRCQELLQPSGQSGRSYLGRQRPVALEQPVELLRQMPGELADGSGFPGSVDAGDQDHRGVREEADPIISGTGDAGQQLDQAIGERLSP